MGKVSTSGNELATTVVSGTFTGTGSSSTAQGYPSQGGGAASYPATVPPTFKGRFNAALWGTFSATVKLECSYDGGATWIVVSKDSAGTEAAYTAPCSVIVEEHEDGVLFRWTCTTFGSGTVNYRISSTVNAVHP